ncbi:MAG: response regulator [Xanthobacteraceae bacterium]|nr:response regulator [Xanthobacteraceae bacterium]
MLSGHGDRWRVVEAAKLGAHEYLLKPVSTRALHERIAAILTVPRPFITLDNYYGPAPRTLFNRDEGRPASAQKPARPPKDAQPGANRPVAASRTFPARPASAGSGEVIEKKIVLL